MGCLKIDKITDHRETCLHCDEYGTHKVEGGTVCQKCFDKYGYDVPTRGLQGDF